MVIMTAEYFYKRLLGYKEEYESTGKYYYGYDNHTVDIHHKDDESNWFIIYADGTVRKDSIATGISCEVLDIADLEGDDFELFSPVQVIKSGYIVLNTVTMNEVKKTISRLYGHIAKFDDGCFLDKKENIPLLCGGSFWENGTTDSFQYYAVNGMEVHLQTVPELCKDNANRKWYGARCIPFIKSMGKFSSIHVSFVYYIRKEYDPNEIKRRCNTALSDLLQYMKDIDIYCKWVDCKMRNPVYL